MIRVAQSQIAQRESCRPTAPREAPARVAGKVVSDDRNTHFFKPVNQRVAPRALVVATAQAVNQYKIFGLGLTCPIYRR